MDHMMPGMDGIEAADAIRSLGTEYACKVPVIALTANAIHGTEKMFFEHGFQAFISKPIDIMEMDSVIRKWVRDESREEAFPGPVAANTPRIGTPSMFDETGDDEDIVIPGVDTDKGLALYAGETDIYLPLLHSYVANTPRVLNKLRDVSAETLSDYTITVHGLKGTSAGIGVETIREAALNLENKSRAGDLDTVLAENDKLIADTETIVANIKEWLERYDARNAASPDTAKPLLKNPGPEVLTRLLRSCEDYDMSGIDQAMSELESAAYEEGGDLVAWLREKIDISEIDETVERLRGYTVREG
jgi:CheY-like chemotaxis protein